MGGRTGDMFTDVKRVLSAQFSLPKDLSGKNLARTIDGAMGAYSAGRMSLTLFISAFMIILFFVLIPESIYEITNYIHMDRFPFDTDTMKTAAATMATFNSQIDNLMISIIAFSMITLVLYIVGAVLYIRHMSKTLQYYKGALQVLGKSGVRYFVVILLFMMMVTVAVIAVIKITCVDYQLIDQYILIGKYIQTKNDTVVVKALMPMLWSGITTYFNSEHARLAVNHFYSNVDELTYADLDKLHHLTTRCSTVEYIDEIVLLIIFMVGAICLIVFLIRLRQKGSLRYPGYQQQSKYQYSDLSQNDDEEEEFATDFD